MHEVREIAAEATLGIPTLFLVEIAMTFTGQEQQ